MGLILNGHHLKTIIKLKIIYEYVLTEEWQNVRTMYPIFTREMETRTKVEPVFGHNFVVSLNKLCDEGKAEVMSVQEYTRKGCVIVKPTNYYRRKKSE